MAMAAMVGCGISFAALMAVPFRIAGQLAGVADGGKYVGLLNSAIVIPQLCVCIASGWVVEASGGSFRQLFLGGALFSCCGAFISWGPLATEYAAVKLSIKTEDSF